MNEYLIGVSLFVPFWAAFYWRREDLRRPMLWSGLYHIAVLTLGFILYWLFFDAPGRTITPDYWSPDTLFDLTRRTGGYGIEDALFMFFTAGVATALHEVISKKKLPTKKAPKQQGSGVLRAGGVVAALVYFLTPLNTMYVLVAFHAAAGLMLVYIRRDLLRRALIGAAQFSAVYMFIALVLTKIIFPTAIDDLYVLNNTSGWFILGVPIEELFYSLAFGFFWSPLYLYKHKLAAQ